MTNKKIAHRPKSTKRPTEKPVDQEIRRAADRAGIERKLAPPESLACNGKAFDGGEGIDPDATVGDLIRLLFEAPNRGPNTLLTDAMLCAADEADLISNAAANDEGMMGDAIMRVAFRMHWRTKVLLELDRRMSAAEEAAGGAS
jgi:hypothetical protein